GLLVGVSRAVPTAVPPGWEDRIVSRQRGAARRGDRRRRVEVRGNLRGVLREGRAGGASCTRGEAGADDGGAPQRPRSSRLQGVARQNAEHQTASNCSGAEIPWTEAAQSRA